MLQSLLGRRHPTCSCCRQETAKKKMRTLLFTPLPTPFIMICVIAAGEVTQEENSSAVVRSTVIRSNVCFRRQHGQSLITPLDTVDTHSIRTSARTREGQRQREKRGDRIRMQLVRQRFFPCFFTFFPFYRCSHIHTQHIIYLFAHTHTHTHTLLPISLHLFPPQVMRWVMPPTIKH